MEGVVEYPVEDFSSEILYPWADSSQGLSEQEEPLEVVAADHNDRWEEGLNTMGPTVAAMFDCSAVMPGADKREAPGAAEVVQRLLSAEEHTWDSQAEQLAKVCWDSE